MGLKWSASIQLRLMVFSLLGEQKTSRGLPLLLLLFLQPTPSALAPAALAPADSYAAFGDFVAFTAFQKCQAYQQNVQGTQAAAHAHPPQVGISIAPGVISPPQVVPGVVPPAVSPARPVVPGAVPPPPPY